MSSVERQVTLGDYRGIHGRTARTIVSIMKRHAVRCTLTARHPDGGRDTDGTWRLMTVDGASILDIMMLAAPFGTSITVRVEGERAAEALSELAEFIAYGPYCSYVSIDEGSNSDPALKAMTREEKDVHLEMLHTFGAANIRDEHQQRRRERANPQLRAEREAREREQRDWNEIQQSRALRGQPT